MNEKLKEIPEMNRRNFLKRTGFGAMAAVGLMSQILPDDNHEGHSHNEAHDHTSRRHLESEGRDDYKTALTTILRLLRQALSLRT
ncbi:twin-arginine translocation signal domain-containing protein [Acidobacteriota bacterium]